MALVLEPEQEQVRQELTHRKASSQTTEVSTQAWTQSLLWLSVFLLRRRELAKSNPRNSSSNPSLNQCLRPNHLQSQPLSYNRHNLMLTWEMKKRKWMKKQFFKKH